MRILLIGLLLIPFNLVSYVSEIKTVNYKRNRINSLFNDTIPPVPLVNNEILNFVNTKINKKVGRGECWDLAAEALNASGAKWDGKFKFGKEINSDLDSVYPGDIIQFKGVKTKYMENGIKYTENMTQHTAIIYSVKGKGVFDLAHQNTHFSGKKVGISELDLKNIVKGKYIIYRPIK